MSDRIEIFPVIREPTEAIVKIALNKKEVELIRQAVSAALSESVAESVEMHVLMDLGKILEEAQKQIERFEAPE